ncbi:hypothetical protein JCM8097_006981 [Rhodosporidiobolus ruineniae]
MAAFFSSSSSSASSPSSSFVSVGSGVFSFTSSECQPFSFNGLSLFSSAFSCTPTARMTVDSSFEHCDGRAPRFVSSPPSSSSAVQPKSARSSSPSSLVRTSRVTRKVVTRPIPTAPTTPYRLPTPVANSPLSALIAALSPSSGFSSSSDSLYSSTISDTDSLFDRSYFSSSSSDDDDDSLISAFSSRTSSPCTTPEPSTTRSIFKEEFNFSPPTAPSPLVRRAALRRTPYSSSSTSSSSCGDDEFPSMHVVN